MGFLLADALDLRYALISFCAVDAATDAVDSVGWEYYNAILPQAVNYHFDVTRIWIFRMDL